VIPAIATLTWFNIICRQNFWRYFGQIGVALSFCDVETRSNMRRSTPWFMQWKWTGCLKNVTSLKSWITFTNLKRF